MLAAERRKSECTYFSSSTRFSLSEQQVRCRIEPQQYSSSALPSSGFGHSNDSTRASSHCFRLQCSASTARQVTARIGARPSEAGEESFGLDELRGAWRKGAGRAGDPGQHRERADFTRLTAYIKSRGQQRRSRKCEHRAAATRALATASLAGRRWATGGRPWAAAALAGAGRSRSTRLRTSRRTSQVPSGKWQVGARSSELGARRSEVRGPEADVGRSGRSARVRPDAGRRVENFDQACRQTLPADAADVQPLSGTRASRR